MDRRRGEEKNWYTLPIEERQRQMEEHGQVGRRYAGQVQQIISGSIGLDDWEWGVDLFSDDPLVFKKLIYEMRFDEVSAVYALFGSFFVGLRCPSDQLGRVLSGEAPRVANWEALLLSNPTGESQCESIAGPHRVAKSPIAVVLSNLFPSQPETSAWHHQAV